MAADPDNPHRQQVFDHWDLLEQLAKRRFPDHGNSKDLSNFALEGLDYVLKELEEDDWIRVRDYQGTSSFKAYLATISQRLLEDFARQKFGRSRVPDWIKKLGPVWVRAFKKLCWERLPATAVIEALAAMPDQKHDPASLWEIVAAIRAKILSCGALDPSRIQQGESDFPDPDAIKALMESAAKTPSIQDLAVAEQHARILEKIAQWLDHDRIPAPEGDLDGNPLSNALGSFSNTLALGAEERLLLRLVFQEGMEVKQAGKRLGLNQNQTHGRLRRLLERIHSSLKASGLDVLLKELIVDDGS